MLIMKGCTTLEAHVQLPGKQMVLLALQPLHTTSYIDKGEASIIANREDDL